MPITYEVKENPRVVVTTWAGQVTAQDLAKHWRKMFSDPQVLGCVGALADVRLSERAFTGEQMAGVVDDVLERRIRELGWRTAILVATPEQYGSVRQYQVYSRGAGFTEIFTDRDAALTWLIEGAVSKK